MTSFMYFQSLVQYRVPIKDDGTLGTPEVTSKFTTEVKGSHKKVKKESKQITIESVETEEI